MKNVHEDKQLSFAEKVLQKVGNRVSKMAESGKSCRNIFTHEPHMPIEIINDMLKNFKKE